MSLLPDIAQLRAGVPSLKPTNIDDRNLDKNSLILKPSAPQTPYTSRKNKNKEAVHWGQLKLLLSEIAFLTYFWDKTKNPNPVVVYAGAAPGHHIPTLINLFPDVRAWYLYDGRDIIVNQVPDKVVVNSNTLFTDDIAKFFNSHDIFKNNVFFISDIRTASFKTMTDRENENAIIKDQEMQKKWVELMQPVAAMLKFRLPWPDRGQERYQNYFDGLVMKQVWEPPTSTETRLIVVKQPDGTYKNIDWDIITYQDQMFHHNAIVREQREYKSEYYQGGDMLDGELIDDYDSMMTLQILGDYLKRRNVEPTQNNIINLYAYILKTLNNDLTSDRKPTNPTQLISLQALRKTGKDKLKYKDMNRWLLEQVQETYE